MRRWLGILIALAIPLALATPADAQVFKPKSKKAAAESKAPAKKKKAAPKKKAPKKQPRTAATKKRPAKTAAADRARPADDEAPDPAPKGAEKDFVKIWDDEQIE
jgi:hypothetical protein